MGILRRINRNRKLVGIALAATAVALTLVATLLIDESASPSAVNAQASPQILIHIGKSSGSVVSVPTRDSKAGFQSVPGYSGVRSAANKATISIPSGASSVRVRLFYTPHEAGDTSRDETLTIGTHTLTGTTPTGTNYSITVVVQGPPPTLTSSPDANLTLPSGSDTMPACFNLTSVEHGGTTYLEARPGMTAVSANAALSHGTTGVFLSTSISDINTGRGVNLNPCVNLGAGTHKVTWSWHGPSGSDPSAGALEGKTSTTYTVSAASMEAIITNVDVNGAGTEATVTWRAGEACPSKQDNHFIKLRIRGTGSFRWVNLFDLNGPAAGEGVYKSPGTFTATGLTPNTEYRFEIRAFGCGGNADAFFPFTTTPTDPPTRPTDTHTPVPADTDTPTMVPTPKTITLSSGSSTMITEGDSGIEPVLIFFTLSEPAPDDFVVLFTTSGSATIEEGNDKVVGCSAPTDACVASSAGILAGLTKNSAGMAIVGDTRNEGNETVVITARGGTSGSTTPDPSWQAGTITITIVDNDGPATSPTTASTPNTDTPTKASASKTITLSADSTMITEGDSTRKSVSITTTLSEPAPSNFAVLLTTSGSATIENGNLGVVSCSAPTDACVATNYPVTAGSTQYTAAIVSIVGDTRNEGNETVVITARGGTSGSTTPDPSWQAGTITLTIVDNDGPATSPTTASTPNTNTPTHTPIPDTNTPTHTPIPDTNTPTHTPIPDTNTPTPTKTNTPTSTKTPTLTGSPAPSATPTPTKTPTPTGSPAPSATPTPTSTPVPGGGPSGGGGGSAGADGFITAPSSAPDAPALMGRNTAIAVNIAAPAANAGTAKLGNPDYTGFDLEYRKGSSGRWIRFTGPITLNRRNLSGAAVITGLENGNEYQVRVRVTRGDGYGPWSSAAAATPMATTPGAIRNLAAKQTAWLSAAESPDGYVQAIIRVTWDPPTDDGGSPITGYDLEIMRGGNGNAIGALTQYLNRKVGSSSGVWKNDETSDMTDLTHTTGRSGSIVIGRDNQWLEFRVGAANAQGAGDIAKVQIQIDKDVARDFVATGFAGTIASDSAASGATPKLTVRLTDLDAPLPVGSRIVLFLEDDFQVPDAIPARSIYFVANSPTSVATGNGAPVYAKAAPEVDTDDYFDADKDDVSIAVRIPDMCSGASDDCEGPNGVAAGQNLTMVILSSSGIKNPSEAGMHTVAFDALGFGDALPGRIERLMEDGMEVSAQTANGNRPIQKRQGVYVRTGVKIALSSAEGKRGETLTVNGSGFSNGTTAAAYVNQRKDAEFAVAKWWNTLNCAKRKAAMGAGADDEFCFSYTLNSSQMTYTVASGNKAASDKALARHLCKAGIVDAGTEAGDATVGSDNQVAISFAVTAPTFRPGGDNLICVEDGEGRTSGAGVEDFELTPSIRVSPDEGIAGDEVTVFAQDFPTVGASFAELKVGGVAIKDGIRATSINADGSATARFKLPPQIGIKRVDAKWGSQSEDTKVTILSAIVNVDNPEPLPNDRLTITGRGFATGSGSGIMPEDITISGAPILVYDDCLDSGEVAVSSGGQFVCAVAVWPAAGADSNPALTPGRHVIKVMDKQGFEGEVAIAIPEPMVKVMPVVAGPRDTVTITGENWPVSNAKSSVGAVTITVTDGERTRQYSGYANGSGQWSVKHRVSASVPIPSTSRVEAKYEDVVKLADITIPESVIQVEPSQCRSGASITLSAENMPVRARVERAAIGPRDVTPNPTPRTDGDGNVEVEAICPELDAGVYSVELEADDTVAIGSVVILPDGPVGVGTPVAKALAPLGDKALAVFYFDRVSKEWRFYDPRPEFADYNTLKELIAGNSYWMLVSEGVADVALNGRSRSLTCAAVDNCWNLLVW